MMTDDRNSLEKLGIISFRYRHDFPDLPVFQDSETNTVIRVLADRFRKKSAVRYDNIADLNDEDKEFFQFSSAIRTIAPSKDNQSEIITSRCGKITEKMLTVYVRNSDAMVHFSHLRAKFLKITIISRSTTNLIFQT